MGRGQRNNNWDVIKMVVNLLTPIHSMTALNWGAKGFMSPDVMSGAEDISAFHSLTLLKLSGVDGGCF